MALRERFATQRVVALDGAIGTELERIARATADEYLAHARVWLEAGAGMIGGCCGTRPEEHALAQRLAQ